MKKIIFIGILLLFQTTVFSRVIIRDGYYINHDLDTVFGSFKLRLDFQDDLFLVRLQQKAYFLDKAGELTIFKPSEILSYAFQYEKEVIKFTSVKYYSKSHLFLKEINEKGCLKLYVHYTEVIDSRTDYGNLSFFLLSYPNSSEEDFYCIEKPDGSLLHVSKLTMKRRLRTFFADYPKLAMKVELGLYNFSDMFWIIYDYNRWWEVKSTITYTDN